MTAQPPFWGGLAVGVAITPLVMLGTFLSAGAGHGDYFLGLLLLPFSMLWSFGINDSVGPLGFLIALVQFPAYGAMIGYAMARSRLWPVMMVIAAHVIAVAASLKLWG